MPTIGAPQWRAHLPPEWLGVVVVNNLAEFDQRATRLAAQFGIEAPGAVRLLEAAGLRDITNSDGSWIVGLARGPNGAANPYPFALIPVANFEKFVQALDGDLHDTFAVVTLAQQDMIAGKCGLWALLVNAEQREILESVIARAANTTKNEVNSQNATNNILSAEISHLGLKWLADFQSVGDQRSRQQMSARRKRGLAMFSLEGAKESLVLDKPIWEWAAETFEQISVEVDFRDGDGALLKVTAAQPQAPAELSPSDVQDVGNPLLKHAWISVGSVEVSPEVAELASGIQLSMLKSAPDELGVEEFAATELAALEESIRNVIGQISNARFMTLSNHDLPVYANRVALVSVTNPEDFLAACGDVQQRWNELIAASKAAVELTFSAEPVEIAGHSGRRFVVDMVEAVDVPRSPEVAKVMADMFGPAGILNWIVLPMGKGQVAISNLPREDLEKLIPELKHEDVQRQTAVGSARMTLDASAYVDWDHRRDLTVTGDTVGGPKFVPLPKSEPLKVGLIVHEGLAELEVALPASLIEILGKHAQETR